MAVRTRQNERRKSSDKPLQKQLTDYFVVSIIILTIIISAVPDVLSVGINIAIEIVHHMPMVVLLDHGDEIAETSIEHGGYAIDTLSDVGGDLLANLGGDSPQSSSQVVDNGDLAPLFTPSIDYWSEDILRWSSQYSLDPNLMATVMQIESCGHPTVGSSAGAQGLFQVMPFHFASSEDQHDPDTNAMRSAIVLNECLVRADGDAGLAMACYNGGPSVLYRDYSTWADETQRYYYWGTGIYADAIQNASQSPVLDEWLSRAQWSCDTAEAHLGIG